ncbi:zinc finger protein 184-like [Sabethes cyaneus]|uniref:zinc finger protein 184-like n=1 Tax=Sabethes cyaneus TaxID=53552 RepID=UPI00237EBF23|nr:zinc finger protein 184-like [Sabethes cyaneus]
MKVCRVCLSPDNQLYHSLFAVREERTIAESIMFCTGLQFEQNDGLSQFVCSFCTEEFLKFFNLRKQCLEADAFLRKTLSSKQSSEESYPNVDETKTTKQEPDLNEEVKIIFHDTSEMPSEISVGPAWTNEWSIEEVQEEYENLETLNSPDNVNPSERSSSEFEPEPKPVLRSPRKRKPPVKTTRKRKKSSAADRPAAKLICCGCPAESFDSQQALDGHRTDQHEKYRITDNVIRPYECDVCFQRFLTQKHLDQHKARPYKKREYVCTSCGNAFFASSTLKKHEEICAANERNYGCDECGKRFTQIGSLRNHLKLHNSEKTHSCPICGKTFLKKFEVPIHMVTHTEEQPFPCDQCPARFKRKQALRNHQRHHSNPTPYKCDLCDEWFNNFSARKFHRQKVHEGIEPFKCDQCGASYGRKNRLDQHVRRVHADGVKVVNETEIV